MFFVTTEKLAWRFDLNILEFDRSQLIHFGGKICYLVFLLYISEGDILLRQDFFVMLRDLVEFDRKRKVASEAIAS